jgi:hypothetical protein
LHWKREHSRGSQVPRISCFVLPMAGFMFSWKQLPWMRLQTAAPNKLAAPAFAGELCGTDYHNPSNRRSTGWRSGPPPVGATIDGSTSICSFVLQSDQGTVETIAGAGSKRLHSEQHRSAPAADSRIDLVVYSPKLERAVTVQVKTCLAAKAVWGKRENCNLIGGFPDIARPTWLAL